MYAYHTEYELSLSPEHTLIFLHTPTQKIFLQTISISTFFGNLSTIWLYLSARVSIADCDFHTCTDIFKAKGDKSRTRKFSLAKFKHFSKGRTTNLFLQECYKVFIGGKALLILIAFAVHHHSFIFSYQRAFRQQTRFITSSICFV